VTHVLNNNKIQSDEKPVVIRRRGGVSAESGISKDLMDTQTRVIEKSENDKRSIQSILSSNFFFSSMPASDLEQVIAAFEPKHYKKGDNIITQGDHGDEYFILVSGVCETFKTFDSGEVKMVKVYNEGDAFGELALMYQIPRQATITVASDTALCFALDRLTFRKTLLTSGNKKRQLYDEFLAKNPLLQSLDVYQKSTIADCLHEYTYLPGDKIIVAGDVTDKRFFFLMSGTAIATKRLSPQDEQESTVMNYTSGDYFGELALISDQPRAANIVATSPCTCAGLDRDAFERLLGPCTQVLQNQDKYQQGEQRAINQQKIAELIGAKKVDE